jgi:hypothetical protein
MLIVNIMGKILVKYCYNLSLFYCFQLVEGYGYVYKIGIIGQPYVKTKIKSQIK